MSELKGQRGSLRPGVQNLDAHRGPGATINEGTRPRGGRGVGGLWRAGEPKPQMQGPACPVPETYDPVGVWAQGVRSFHCQERPEKKSRAVFDMSQFFKCGQWAHIPSLPFSARHSFY